MAKTRFIFYYVKSQFHQKKNNKKTKKKKIGEKDSEKKALLTQVKNLNCQYPGGLVSYYENALKLLDDSAKGVNPYDGWVPSVPSGNRLEFNSPEFIEFEKLGAEQLAYTGFVLVAGWFDVFFFSFFFVCLCIFRYCILHME